MSFSQLLDLTREAFEKTQLTPATGIWGSTRSSASASGALIKAFGEFPQVTDQDWLNGFDLGFEQGRQHEIEFLTYGNTRRFVEGFKMGTEIGKAILED